MSSPKKFVAEVLFKADEAKRQLHGVIYAADVLDTQGEFTTVAELEKAAHKALADGVQIDVEHNNKPLHKSHAALVQSWVEGGAWNGIVQLSKQAWDQLIVPGKLKAFSMGGVAARRAGSLLGKAAREMHDIQAKFISLVPAGANREQFVAKADDQMPAWARQIADQQQALLARIETLGGVLKGEAPVTDLRKQALLAAEVQADVEADGLRRQLMVKSRALEALWEGGSMPGESRVQSEQRLCRDIHELELRLEALGKSARGVGLNDPGRSAFSTRGGTSSRLTAVAGDSAFERRAEDLEKRSAPISTLRV